MTYSFTIPKISEKNLSEYRERTREALFATLSDLVTAKGFDVISVSDLANESGIGRTAIYNHFSDKEELLLAYIELRVNVYMDRTSSKLARTDSPLNRLRVYTCKQMLARCGHLFSLGTPLRGIALRETAVALRERTSVTGRPLRRILGEYIEAGAVPDQNLDVTVQLL